MPIGLRDRLRGVGRATVDTLVALARVLRLVWESSGPLTLVLALVAVGSGLTPAVMAYLTKTLVNVVVEGISLQTQHRPDQLTLPVPTLRGVPPIPMVSGTMAVALLAGALFAILFLNSLLRMAGNLAQQLLQERVTLHVQLMVMQHAARLDMPFFEDPTSYDLLRRAQQEAAMRPVFMVSSVVNLIQMAVTLLSMATLLLAVSPPIAAIALLCPVPGFLADLRYGWHGYNLQRWASPLRRRMQYLTTLVTTDTFAKEVQLYELGQYFIHRFRALARTYYERQRRLLSRRHVIGFLWSSLTTVAGSLTYLYVALQALSGNLTLGDLALYTAAAASVQSSMQGLLSGFSSLYEHSLYLSTLYDLLAKRPSLTCPARPVRLPQKVRGEIQFDHVSFAYPGSRHIALSDVSFRIGAAETVAVVGRNGAGKSTLLKLVCRLYDPTEGRVLLDGVDIRSFDPVELRSVMAAMFQDFVSYQATAAENVGLGHLPALEDRPAIVAASSKGDAHELISKLPAGYDTPLGKWFAGGVNLSGGEWQKVALSRAFMRDARILLLDEPTSALDAQAENDLLARLGRLSSGRTAMYISHRFSTVRQADRILVLEHGELVEEGNHDDLMVIGGHYASLFRIQVSHLLRQHSDCGLDRAGAPNELGVHHGKL
jgi:ATP-binding cassette subfamily B protein